MERNRVSSPDGTRIVWMTLGQGDGVVIVPGSLSDGSDWVGFAERSKAPFAVHVMSRRGHGDSGDGRDYALEREYEDIVAVLTATGSARLVGHSFGAICALGAALLHGGLEKLVAYEPPLTVGEPVVPADGLAEMERAADRGDRAGVVDIGLRRFVRLPWEAVDRIKATGSWEEMVRHSATWPREMRALHEKGAGVAGYAKITARTLLPVGETTQQHHRDAAEALRAVIPDARLVEIARSGHQGHLEAPDDLARGLIAFLM